MVIGPHWIINAHWPQIGWDPQISSSGYLLDWTPTHTCRMLLGRREPTSRQNDQNTLKFGQKQHFYATILARRRQNGPRRHQTLRGAEIPRSWCFYMYVTTWWIYNFRAPKNPDFPQIFLVFPADIQLWISGFPLWGGWPGILLSVPKILLSGRWKSYL